MLREPAFDTIAGTGWQARLGLRFARREDATILAERRHRGPLRVQKALHPEGPGVCHAIVLHPPSGIAGGDELEISVDVGAEAHALLTTPGAGKWYRSAAPWASQTLSFEVGANAMLEWLPQETIIFDGALADLRSHIRLATGSRYLGWEVLCLGRRASNECFANGDLKMSTRIEQDGKLLWLEQGRLTGGSPLLDSPVGLAGSSVCGTLIAAGEKMSPALLAACRAVAASENGAQLGLTTLPQLLVARYLGHSSEAARAWFVALWRVLRPALLGREVQTPRIWNT
ncbi:MAG: urease accessory protein UreD [Proteobacteria bacterium]|nr:urease accessory protein UreD [Pseudomonadota bacterium]